MMIQSILGRGVASILLLSGCGGGGSGAPSFALGGTVAGLASGGQLVLLSGAGTQVTLAANGNFRFPDRLAQGSKYSLSVQWERFGWYQG
jgi:hypothetical protein